MQERMYYLDALRAFAMLFGVMVHTTTLSQSVALDWIAHASDFFRMPTFFMLAGFFSYMTFSRAVAKKWLIKRCLSLILPLIFVLISFNPLTNYLVYCYHEGPVPFIDYFLSDIWQQSSNGPGVWHLHLWFLFSLLIYSAVMPLLVIILRSNGIEKLINQLPVVLSGASWRTLLLPIVVGVVCVGTRIVFEMGFEPWFENTPFEWILRTTFAYFPYFLLGTLLFISPALFDFCHRPNRILLVLTALFIIGLQAIDQTQLTAQVKVLKYFAKGFCATVLIMALLFLFQRFLSSYNRWVSLASSASYTVYLLHYAVIYGVAVMLPQVITDNVAIQFVLVCCLTYALTFAIHFCLVSRHQLLKLLFNGSSRNREELAAN